MIETSRLAVGRVSDSTNYRSTSAGILALHGGRKIGQSEQIKQRAAGHDPEGFPMRLPQLTASAVLVLLQLGAAVAQEWPTRYITAIVPFGPGNSVDIVGRVLAGRMSELLGQQVVVENIAGAGGSTGTLRAARAAPDGYTIAIGGTDTMA